MRRYRRQAFYNYDTKQWTVFYKNTEGKIIVDKRIKTYQAARKEVSKNLRKRTDDIFNKKQSALESSLINEGIQSQNRIDKLIKKKKLTKQEKQDLQELSETAGYKRKAVKKKVKTRKKKEEKPIQTYERNILSTYFNGTSAGFFTPEENFKQIKKEITATFKKYKPDRLQIELDDYTGVINYADLKTQEKFEKAVEGVISGQGSIPWTRGKTKIKLSLIKR